MNRGSRVFRFRLMSGAGVVIAGIALRADYRRLEEMGERNYISTTAAALSERAAGLFERKGNIVSARRARQLAERLRSAPSTS
jgi:hypothetical protein